jgi:hypothetical protein
MSQRLALKGDQMTHLFKLNYKDVRSAREAMGIRSKETKLCALVANDEILR